MCLVQGHAPRCAYCLRVLAQLQALPPTLTCRVSATAPLLQHAYLGSGIMALFVVHAALGLQLGLSI